jgi:CRISPR-associated protein Cas2
MEIATGVYVGRISARVRDKLWDRVVETAKGGRAVLVFSTNNEQRMDFRVHGETWEPLDFDGLKLILRPSPARLMAKQSNRQEDRKKGFSNAAKYQRAKQFSKKNSKGNETVSKDIIIEKAEFPTSYVIIDIETTGLGPTTADIIEIGVLKIIDGEVMDSFQSLVRAEKSVPDSIIGLTGITDEDLSEDGKELIDVITTFKEFVGEMPLVAHNMPFDLSFLNVAFEKNGLERLANQKIDTLALAKRICPNLDSYKLGELSKHLGLESNYLNGEENRLHRSMGDCHITNLLFQKLMKMEQVGL